MLNALIFFPPRDTNSKNTLLLLWYEKVKYIKDKFIKHNSIFNLIFKINNKINEIFNSNTNFINYNNLNENINIVEDENNEQLNEDEKNERKKEWKTFYEKNTSLDYRTQLKSPAFVYEDEIEGINIIHEDEKIKYCSIDLLLKKICEDNSFNIEIYINDEKTQTFNFINAFIYQCFGFTSYEIIINKLFELHNLYKYNNILNSKRKNRLLHFIFKIVKYLFDHKKYGYFYFQFSDDLENKITNFLKANNLKKEVKSFLEYKKSLISAKNTDINESWNIVNIEENKIKSKLHIINSYNNIPHEGFEFNILKYNEKDIALVITHIRIKKLIQLYDNFYEFNPKIKFGDKKNRYYLNEIIEFFNKLGCFFLEEVYSYDFLNVRVEIVEKIILILIELRKLNNFHDLLAINTTLTSISMHLSQTWNQINSKLKSIYQEINNFCSFDKNYKNIRNEEINCWNENIFFIPNISFVSKDLLFLEEAMKYIGDKGLVNIEKIIKCQKIIEQFKYKFKNILRKKDNMIILPNNNSINELKIFFYNLNPREFDDILKIGDKLEPKFTLYKERDNRKRKTKTDLYINSNQFLKY